MKTLKTCSILIALVAFVFTANAQDNWFNQMEVMGFTSATYGYNLNNPAGEMNDYRIFDQHTNSIILDVFELSFMKAAEKAGDAGMRVDFVAGNSIPRNIHSSGMFQGEDVDLKQAYVSYIAPVGNGLQIDFGKFVTHLGYELIEGNDGYNDNVTRSFCFGYTIPFTHTGLRLNYGFNDAVSAMLMVANGWDNSLDNNKNKTLGAQVALTPIDPLGLYFNAIYGAEQDNNNSNNRTVLNFVGTYAVTDAFSVGVNVVNGMEDAAMVDEETGNPIDVTWMGFGAYLRYDLNDWFSLALRGEQLDDTDGARTGLVQKLTSITLTPEFRAGDGFVFRFDVRLDSSDEEVFHQEADDDGKIMTDTQNTVTLNMLYLLD